MPEPDPAPKPHPTTAPPADATPTPEQASPSPSPSAPSPAPSAAAPASTPAPEEASDTPPHSRPTPVTDPGPAPASAADPAPHPTTPHPTTPHKADPRPAAPYPAPPASPHLPSRRRPFQPVTIRTARDAVTAAALYLRWLGYQDIRRADQRPPSGIGLAARGLVVQVDPTMRPASPRDVECLWLTAMTESAHCVYFSLAGFADDARDRANSLGIPLFVLDLTGTPQPVNRLADELEATGT
ncbi:hypothetical protein [Streptomyces sp. NPDC087212]|uniref:hypothetical protein n=1 Tax=Streptomyces sp. NPDC087212 TaxID=3365766 RepID=UPI0038306F98